MKWVYCLAFCWFLEEDLWKVFWLPIWDRPLELVRVETRFLATIFCSNFLFGVFLAFFAALHLLRALCDFILLLQNRIINLPLLEELVNIHQNHSRSQEIFNFSELISSARVKSLVIRLCPHISWWIIEDTDIPKNSLTKLRKTYFELNGKLAI